MNRFFTLLFAVSCLTAVGQVPDYVPTDGLFAWFDVNGSFTDEMSNIDAMSIDISFVHDRESTPDEAMEFNGLTSWISLGDIDPISEGQAGELSFSFWVSPYSWNDQQISFLFGDEIYQNDGVLLQLDESLNGLTAYPGPGSSYVACECLPEFNNWTHVVYVQNAESIQVYLDGSGFTLSTSLNVETEYPWRIGAFEGGAYFDRVFHGAIDEVGFWNRALTGDEVHDLFIEQSQVQGCTDSSACNFNAEANIDDGSCHFNCQFCLIGTVWSEELGGCIGDGSGDINLDGCVQLNDLLDLLSAYGDCGAEESVWQCGNPLEYQGYDYETVQIGEQCWFAENLKVLTFDNGEAIPFMGEIGAGVSAMAYPDGSESLYEQFGGLYNWFATDDERGLCPNTWRVSTDEDWVILEGHLSSLNLDGGALKRTGSSIAGTSSWNEPNEGATNVLGFNAEAAGQRNFDLAFERFGERGWYWAYSIYPKMARELQHDSSNLGTLSTDQHDCLSIRCIKD